MATKKAEPAPLQKGDRVIRAGSKKIYIVDQVSEDGTEVEIHPDGFPERFRFLSGNLTKMK